MNIDHTTITASQQEADYVIENYQWEPHPHYTQWEPHPHYTVSSVIPQRSPETHMKEGINNWYNVQ